MNRREMIFRTAAATLGMALSGCAVARSSQDDPKKVLFFSKSSDYQHSVITRKGKELSFAEKILASLGPKHGIDFTFSKDGSLFTIDYLAGFDAYFFYTSGDLTGPGKHKDPPMTPLAKKMLLDAVQSGKGFIGTHSAADTFHVGEPDGFDTKQRAQRYHNYGEKADPYARMLGGEFIIHGNQQVAKMRVADPKFPGMPQQDFSVMEEWYTLKDFSNDLHVLMVQETEGMKGAPYQRPPYPTSWARMHGGGRVFYTSMGHREDVWTNPLFQKMLFGGIAWAVGNVNADITPNIHQVAPGYATLPPQGT
jgi:type 1 glutamine amidotransferase